MKRALNLVLAATFMGSAVSSVVSSTAFAQDPAPKDITSSQVQFNTNIQRPASTFNLIPAIAYGGGGMATETDANGFRVSPTSASNYEAGVLAEFGRGTFVFQTGLMYINEDVKMQVDSTTLSPLNSYMLQNGDLDANLKYIGIPLMGKARVRIANGVRLAGRIGFMPAILAGGQETLTMRETDLSGNVLGQLPTATSEPSGLRAVNCFAMIGAGPEFRVARDQNIRVEANYERMLLPVQSSDSEGSFAVHTWNAMLSYGLGF